MAKTVDNTPTTIVGAPQLTSLRKFLVVLGVGVVVLVL